MSETATVQILEVKEGATGTSSKGKWTRYDLIDEDGVRYATFSRSVYEAARPFAGRRAEVEFENEERGLKLVAVKPTNGASAADVAELPAGIEVRRDFAANAWDAAVVLAGIEVRAMTGREVTPALVFDVAQKYANEIFLDLLRKGRAIEDADIPL